MIIGKKSDLNDLFNTSSREGHIIEDVPYVGQENSIFCSYACPTMIFKFLGRNLSLDDLVFSAGIGYSLSYSIDYYKYFPISGTFISQWPSDRSFVADLYGLEFITWFPTDLTTSIPKIWEIYWNKIKSYLKDDIPISTGVDVLSLPSARKLMDYNLWVNAKKVPEFAWRLISTAHEILIVGFDEEKKEIYYNDPVATVLGKSQEGSYASAPFETFAKAVLNTEGGKFNPKFIINTYSERKSALSKEIIFNKSRERNLEKIKGNPSAYDKKWRKYPFGINALNAIVKDFVLAFKEKNNDVLASYRRDSFKIAYMKKISQFFTKKNSPMGLNDSFTNLYDIVSLEKKLAYEYLINKNSKIEGLDEEIKLLHDELEKWNNISDFYSHFFKEFSVSKNKNQLKINKNIISNILEIIEIEKNIIKCDR